ncbi:MULTISPECIES: MarR family transcriptional regulator [unclassified Beijerinckia]|uniref:MarR family winged helix-turn-helix transcriptional regulator n=1 Tax=unclassified Beijerinckia TaxID=2638183 RepID=UPI00089CC9AF|nr:MULTISPECIES: MarR family transcriptional regulator [unclassified Beijerinckia]MDH7795108.1 DNA-binding MarR family transcriptional regulator [Beijerinckia sp. GAS462]SEB87857.1 transcriptional regulator, MarR family [Beijerinckia sp. 28-YEA-48]
MNAKWDDQQAAVTAALAQDLRALVSQIRRRLRDQAHLGGDLTPTQTSVLLRLEKHGPATTSELARAEGIRPQSMGTVIAALEEAGLVAGAPDPTDGRRTILSLTKACMDWIQQSRAARQDWLSRTLDARLSQQEQNQVAAAVALLRRLIDD